jgi:hypothetical protein
MTKKNLGVILEKDIHLNIKNNLVNKEYSNRQFILLKNKTLAVEGITDLFFGKKKKEEPIKDALFLLESLKEMDYTLHHDFKNSQNLINYLNELVHYGLPLLEKDLTRMEKILDFINSKGKDIAQEQNLQQLNKLSVLVKDPSFKKDNGYIFKTFTIEAYGDVNVTQIKNIRDKLISESHLDDDNTDEEKVLIGFPDIIQSVNFLYPRGLSEDLIKEPVKVGDNNHKKLIEVATALIKKCKEIDHGERIQKFRSLLNTVDKKVKPFEDDSSGLWGLYQQSLGYMYQIKVGFNDDILDIFKK